MAVEDYIARGPAPSQIQSLPEIANQAAQAQSNQQAVQLNQLKILQEQRAMASQTAIQKAFTDANGDLDQTLALAPKYGALPSDIVALQQHVLTTKKTIADLDKDQLETHQKHVDIAAGQVNSLLALPEDQAAAQWPGLVQGLIKSKDVKQGELPDQYPGHQGLQQYLLGANGYKNALTTEQKNRELQAKQEEADAAQKKAEADAARTGAELPGLKAESDRKQMVADAMKAAQADPQKGAAAIDAALPPNVDAQANAGYKAAYTSAMQAGNMEAAAKIVEAAAQHSAGMSPAMLKKEVDKQVAIDKATQPLKLQQAIATARAMSGTGAVANVPPHLAAAAITAYQKSGSALATAQTAADDIQTVLNSAAAGNKAAGANVPLVGVGALNAVNGIKRINSAEIAQYGTAGSLIDRIQGKLQGWAEGQPIPKDVLSDMSALHQQLAQGAVMKHAREVQSINQSYGSTFAPMQLDAKPQAATSSIPDVVKSLLSAATVKPGVHKLSDGSTWVKAADGSISKQ